MAERAPALRKEEIAWLEGVSRLVRAGVGLPGVAAGSALAVAAVALAHPRVCRKENR
jgi:hypothetical protein